MGIHSLAFFLGAVLAGLSTALLVFVTVRSAMRIAPEDRAWRDPPPRFWELIWWLVRWLEPVASLVAPLRWLRNQAKPLREAGLEFAVTPAQYAAVRAAHALLASAVATVAAAWMVLDPLPWTLAWIFIAAGLAGWIWPALVVRDRAAKRRIELLRALPFYMDVVTLCVEAGLNLQGALGHAVAKGPPGALRDELQRCLRDVRAGKARSEALTAMAERAGEPGLSQFVSAVIQAESLGMSLGPVLRAQADQRRSERFLRAEKLAMQAPVKLLLPLIACIFPCTFIVLFFPIAMKLLQPGI